MYTHYLLLQHLHNLKSNISVSKGGSDGGAGGAWAPPLFEALFKNSMLLENNGDCEFQLSSYQLRQLSRIYDGL